MAKKKNAGNNNLPGTIYLNKNRYWWKVQLPGETTAKARPLRPVGAKFATGDHSIAIEVAKNLYEAAVFNSGRSGDMIDDGHTDSVGSVARAYVEFADEYYCNANGKVTKEPANIRYSLKFLVEMFGVLQVAEFGPLKLIEVRNRMIKMDWSRGVINHRIGRIKRMFKWAVSRQIVFPMVYHGLMAVEGLKQGRSGARETEPVKARRGEPCLCDNAAYDACGRLYA